MKRGAQPLIVPTEARQGNACMMVHICGDVFQHILLIRNRQGSIPGGSCPQQKPDGTENCWVMDCNWRNPS